MDWKNIIDMPIHHTTEVVAEQIPDIINYCINDVRSTKQIMQLSKEQINLRKALTEEYNIDLTTIDSKPLKAELFKKGVNEFEFTLPSTGNKITFKLLTGEDEKKINAELEGLKKINKNSSAELSTRLKYIITSINGNRDQKDIREFVDTQFLARDSRALREYIKEVQPDVDLTFFPSGSNEKVSIPVGLSFFWPDI
jgi:hypothetical protein